MTAILGPMVVVALLGASPPAPTAEAPAAWAEFLNAPTRRRYERLARSLDACTDAACAPSVTPEPAAVARLVKLVELGQPMAVDAAMEAYRFLSGSVLDEVSRALGGYSEAHPFRFLYTAQEHRLSTPELQRIVRTLPRSAGGDDIARRSAAEKRIQALSEVDEPELAREKTVALEALRTGPEPRSVGRTLPPRVR